MVFLVNQKLIDENLFKVVTPERFYRGSSPNLVWIPAKGMRE